MAEYIARKEANEWVADWLRADRNWRPYSKGENIPTVEVFDILARIPAADVQPVKHGKWIDYNPDNENDPRCICSVCGSIEFPLSRHKYCPICGAKMDGKEDGRLH